MQRLQSTLDTRLGVLQHLAEQTADAANQMTTAVNALQQKLNTQNDAASGKLDTDLRAGAVAERFGGRAEGAHRQAGQDRCRTCRRNCRPCRLRRRRAQPGGAHRARCRAQAGDAASGTGSRAGQARRAGPSAPAAQQAPPLQETLQAGVRDYNAGRYDVAQGEFQDVVHYYPLDDLAGTAQFYLGEIAYQQKDYATAISAYNAVLEGFSGNAKAPAAQLHKGYALLAENKQDEGIHELRSLIQRHPQTPEAHAARSKLNGMGVKIDGALRKSSLAPAAASV